MKIPALFLDRDGVINLDHGYVHEIDHFTFIDGIFDLVRSAKQKGFLVFVVTNQAGIGRGYYDEQQFSMLTDWMMKKFSDFGAAIDKVYHCPHHPVHGRGTYRKNCSCRKPKPGMIKQAVREYNVDLRRSVLIGDSSTDMQAAEAAGIGLPILFSQKNDEEHLFETVSDLNAATQKLEAFIEY